MMMNVVSGMDLMTATAEQPVNASSSGSDDSPVDVFFDDVLQQFVEHAADTETRDERLDALRSTIETLDDSEVVGFLAMLENQMNWQVEQQPQAEVVDLQAWRQQVQDTVQDVVEGSGQSLSEAAGKALEKALEHYMPADESERQAEVLLQKERLAADSSESLRNAAFDVETFAVERPRSYQPAPEMKLQMVTEVMSDQLAVSDQLTMPSTQSSIELLGAVPTTALAQRADAAPVQTMNNPAVAQTATQANPEISLRQENWSDAMGQRLVTMIGEGRQEANIRLDPPELGTIGVRLVIEESGVTVQMASAVPQVRELLDGQSDRLRLALESQGYQQVDVNVGSDSDRQFARQGDAQSGSGFSGQNAVGGQADVDAEDSLQPHTMPTGFINTFA